MTQLTEVEAGEATARRAAYLDLLRLVALIGVIIYQWFGWAWTPIVIPFAALTLTVAGALIAASLDRSVAFPWTVLAKRVRRVVLPVWGLAAVAVPLMVWYGSAAGARTWHWLGARLAVDAVVGCAPVRTAEQCLGHCVDGLALVRAGLPVARL